MAPDTENAGTAAGSRPRQAFPVSLHEQRAANDVAGRDGPRARVRRRCQRPLPGLDHETGDVLWEINLGSAITGFLTTYAVNRRQFAAVTTGSGVSWHFTGLTPTLRPNAGNNLFAFALPR